MFQVRCRLTPYRAWLQPNCPPDCSPYSQHHPLPSLPSPPPPPPPPPGEDPVHVPYVLCLNREDIEQEGLLASSKHQGSTPLQPRHSSSLGPTRASAGMSYHLLQTKAQVLEGSIHGTRELLAESSQEDERAKAEGGGGDGRQEAFCILSSLMTMSGQSSTPESLQHRGQGYKQEPKRAQGCRLASFSKLEMHAKPCSSQV